MVLTLNTLLDLFGFDILEAHTRPNLTSAFESFSPLLVNLRPSRGLIISIHKVKHWQGIRLGTSAPMFLAKV